MPDKPTGTKPPSELEMFSVASCGPPMSGANVTLTVVDASAASTVATGAPTENCAAFVPVIVNGVVKITLDGETLWIVTGTVAELPTFTVLKLIEVGAAVRTAGADVMSARLRGNS